MSEQEKKILETFGKIIPSLSELEKEKLLAFGEGMAFKANNIAGMIDATTNDQAS